MFVLRFALSVSLFGLVVAPVRAQDVPAAPAAAPTAATEVEAERPPRVRTLSTGIGYHSTMFRTEQGGRYALHGPSVVFDYFVGRRWGFAFRGEAFFPLVGREAGANAFRGSLRGDYSDRHNGFDLLFMAAYRQVINERLVITYAGGIHLHMLKIAGPDVPPIEMITGGLGGVGRLEYTLHGKLYLAAELALGIDPIDFIAHQNRAVVTTPLSGAIMLGFRH